ncbi:MAG TPA: hypothetical protein VER96_16575 [Polyangiaceae bacterium]|nr:hypothetical protein [Polyangiaceae bacterium]
MRGAGHLGQLLLGAAALLGLGGCAGQQAESLQLSEELGRARADAAWQRSRVAEFEERMSRLEQRAGVAQSMQRADERALLSRLERLIAINERLVAERAAAQPPAQSPASSDAKAAQAVPTQSTADDEQALRALVERLRGHPGSPHGGLSREQEEALRVLTRPERVLDTENPWPATFY